MFCDHDLDVCVSNRMQVGDLIRNNVSLGLDWDKRIPTYKHIQYRLQRFQTQLRLRKGLPAKPEEGLRFHDADGSDSDDSGLGAILD